MLHLQRSGKVRDIYELDEEFQNQLVSDGDESLVMVASDRISAFDVVLPTTVPNKGVVLNQLSAFWFEQTRDLIPNHLIAVISEDWLDSQSQIAPGLRDQLGPFVGRGMLVRKAQRIDIECIVRGYLAGSAWSEYKRNGTIWGYAMPEGLKEGERLPEPMFTPTTKAEEGHDQNMSRQQVEEMVGADMADELEQKSLALYSFAHAHALQKGIILVDTKMEFGLLDGRLILIDELLTPDSSRFWDAEGYEAGRSLPNYDKQYVRDWLDAQAWDREPPAPALPEEVVRKTAERYLEAYRRLTGRTLAVPQT